MPRQIGLAQSEGDLLSGASAFTVDRRDLVNEHSERPAMGPANSNAE